MTTLAWSILGGGAALLICLIAFVVWLFKRQHPGTVDHGGHGHDDHGHHPSGFLMHSWWFWVVLGVWLGGVYIATQYTSYATIWPAFLYAAWVMLLFAWRFLKMMVPKGDHPGEDGHAGHGPEERDTGVAMLDFGLLGMTVVFLIVGWLAADELTPMYPPTVDDLTTQEYWGWFVALAQSPWTWLTLMFVSYNPRFRPVVQKFFYGVLVIGFIAMIPYALGWFPFRAAWQQWHAADSWFTTVLFWFFPPHF